jgi:hypothetical protein
VFDAVKSQKVGVESRPTDAMFEFVRAQTKNLDSNEGEGGGKGEDEARAAGGQQTVLGLCHHVTCDYCEIVPLRYFSACSIETSVQGVKAI